MAFLVIMLLIAIYIGLMVFRMQGSHHKENFLQMKKMTHHMIHSLDHILQGHFISNLVLKSF